MTGRAVLPLVVAALLAVAGLSPAGAQALGPSEAHGIATNVKPNIALTASQKSAIYGAVLRQRLRSTSAANIPLIAGAPVPRSAALLALPDEAVNGEDAAQFLKYAIVEGNVVLVDSISMRVVDILHGGVAP